MSTDLEQLRAAARKAMDALETDDLDERREAFEGLQDLFEYGAVLGDQPSTRLNDEDHRECGRCGHTALWHSNVGKGECQVRVGCACHEFLASSSVLADQPSLEGQRELLEAADAFERLSTMPGTMPPTFSEVAQSLRFRANRSRPVNDATADRFQPVSSAQPYPQEPKCP